MLALYIFVVLIILATCLYLPELFIIMHFRQKRKAGTRVKKATNYFPKVSIILPVYNEEKLIQRKIENMLELNYPRDLIEIIVVDGNSTDRTFEYVKKFEKEGIKPIRQKEREGVTEAVKKGVCLSESEIIIMTDAEALFEPNAVRFTVEDLADPMVGAVSGYHVISNLKKNFITNMESTYGDSFETMRFAESALYSTSHFRGEIVGVRRELFPFNMNSNQGSLDRGIAFNVIRNDRRAICDERVKFYENAADSLRDRNLQKKQRGTLLQEIMLQNLDMVFNSKFKAFGMLILPSNFCIYFIFPLVFGALLIVFPFALLDIASHSPLVAFILIATIISTIASTKKAFLFFTTFFHSQFMLITGLIRIAANCKPRFLEQVEGTRK